MFAKSNEPNIEVLTNQSAYNVSERYRQISTQDVLDEMNNYSDSPFEITGYHQANVRKAAKVNMQKHLVMLQRNDSEMLDGTHMNIVLYNSSDRSSTLRLYLGSYREACSNGIVWGDDIAEPLAIRHTGEEAKWKQGIKDLMYEYENVQQETQYMIERMIHKDLSYNNMAELAHRAANEIINPIIEGEIIDPLEMLVAKRIDDTPKTLWATYNKLQEYAIQGSLRRIIKKTDPDQPQRLIDVISKTHKISDVSKQLTVNRELHDMVLELL